MNGVRPNGVANGSRGVQNGPRVGPNGTRMTVNSPRARTPVIERDYHTCRIVILGSPGVGKTALAVRYMTRRFIGEYCPTLESIHKVRSFVDNEEVKLEILDTAGYTTESGCIWKDFYAYWGDCYLFVYSINDKNGFEEILNLKRQVDSVRQTTSCGLLVGNKSDLLHDRQVTAEEAVELADEIGCRFCEVSAADWTHIDEVISLFHDAVREFRKSQKLRDMRARRPSSSVRFRQAIQKVITGKGSSKRFPTT